LLVLLLLLLLLLQTSRLFLVLVLTHTLMPRSLLSLSSALRHGTALSIALR